MDQYIDRVQTYRRILIEWRLYYSGNIYILSIVNNLEQFIFKLRKFKVWTTGTDPEIAGLLGKGYRLIISNYDALYFDCGFGAWVGEGILNFYVYCFNLY